MKHILAIVISILLLLVTGCVSPYRTITYTVATKPVYTLHKSPQKILLLNLYNVQAKKFRDNKEALFTGLIDELLDSAAKKINAKTGIVTEPLLGYTNNAGNADSVIAILMVQKNATHVIAISTYDVYFSQTNVDVTRDTYSGSKKREAFYDIVSDINFLFYGEDTIPKNMDMLLSRKHSSRAVISGLLAAGPNIVVQKDDARNISIDNLQQYLNYYFPGQKTRTRTLLSEKGFERMLTAVDSKDYETALAEAKSLTSNPAKYKAAIACFDCAVFYEMKGQIPEALDYLRMALSNYPLLQASNMISELQP